MEQAHSSYETARVHAAPAAGASVKAAPSTEPAASDEATPAGETAEELVQMKVQLQADRAQLALAAEATLVRTPENNSSKTGAPQSPLTGEVSRTGTRGNIGQQCLLSAFVENATTPPDGILLPPANEALRQPSVLAPLSPGLAALSHAAQWRCDPWSSTDGIRPQDDRPEVGVRAFRGRLARCTR